MKYFTDIFWDCVMDCVEKNWTVKAGGDCNVKLSMLMTEVSKIKVRHAETFENTECYK